MICKMAASTTNDYYEVLYNDCYGGFDLPDSFVEKVFEKYPPDSEVGESLFSADKYVTFVREDDSTIPDNHYYKITESIPLHNGYFRVRSKYYFKNKDGTFNERSRECTDYVTKDYEKYYYLSCDRFGWRDSAEVIEMARTEGIIGVKHGHSLVQVQKVPIGYIYDINEYDGKESVGYHIPYNIVIQELVHCVKTGDKTKFSPLTLKIIDGSVKVY